LPSLLKNSAFDRTLFSAFENYTTVKSQQGLRQLKRAQDKILHGGAALPRRPRISACQVKIFVLRPLKR
jgi:hypothetical protein